MASPAATAPCCGRYVANDSGRPAQLKQLRDGCIVPTDLELKPGALVMLCKNIDQVTTPGPPGGGSNLGRNLG